MDSFMLYLKSVDYCIMYIQHVYIDMCAHSEIK